MAKTIDENFDFTIAKRTYEPIIERQGSLDNLCGIYCIINAVNYVAKLSLQQRNKLFKKLVKKLNLSVGISNNLLHGMSAKQLQSMFKITGKHLAKKYNLKLKISPFFEPDVRIGLQEYLAQIETFLSGKNCIIVAGIEGIHSHWTCVSGITPKTVKLLDSDGLSHLKINNCCIRKQQKPSKHCLHPIRTWAVWLEA